MKNELYSITNLKTLFGFIDLTSLNSTDTEEKIKKMCLKVNGFKKQYPDIPNVAAICIYPSLVKIVRKNLNAPGVKIASVSAGFPSSPISVCTPHHVPLKQLRNPLYLGVTR